MADRELLEQAAKAAGYWIVGPVDKYIVQLGHYENGFVIRNDRGGDSCWNPIADDGDALRLAVKLVLDIEFVWDDVPEETAIACVRVTAIGGEACVFEELGFDPSAATRRAIVRAAAEIGKVMT